jgi:LysM repeat protein
MRRTIYAANAITVVLALGLLLFPLAARPAYADDGSTYVVRQGDTMTSIAARHGLTASQLAAANGLNWNAWVYAGQRLHIPALPGQPGRAPSSPAAPAPASTGGVPTGGGTYVIRPGDTLSKLSRSYGISVSQLAAANGLGQNAWLYAGQRLRIPGQAPSSPTTSGQEATAPAPAIGSGTYIVRPGDTLIRIAIRHGITTQRLAMANGMNVNSWVYVGQQLKIPSPTTSSPTTSGSTSPSSTTSRSTTSGPTASGSTTSSPTTPGQRSSAPAPAAPAAGSTYVVRPGDTLTGIAFRHGVSANQLAAANGLRDGTWVYVGQKLEIPGPGSAQSPNPARPQPAVPPPSQPTGAKWIDINLSTQTLAAYAGQTPVFRAVVSTGTQATPTVVGTYHVYSKYLSTSMSGPGYSVPNVPHVMFFYRGYSIHGTYWHNNFGTPMSHGCVNLTLADAKWLYEWAPMGVKVVTHY